MAADNTIKLFKLTSRIVGIPDRFSFVEPGEADFGSFSVDDGKDYLLPEGYEADETMLGMQVFDPLGNPCEILVDSSGLPSLVSGEDAMPVLRHAA